jgi:SPP1 gp7 family putative phage head morphogenesis protein
MPDLTRLPFEDAITYFRQKLNIPTEDSSTIQGEEYDWAFSVAGVMSAEMLADFRAAVERYIAEGKGFAQFASDYQEIAQRYGWEPKQGVAWRADIAAKTNMRMSYAAGQYQQRQNPEIKKRRPGLMWRWRDSPHPRPHHKAMDGKVFDGNDPQWSGLSLPSGWGCRCRIFSVPAPDDGYFDLSDRLAYKQPSGEIGEVPAVKIEGKLYPIADNGFYYTPGTSPNTLRPAVLEQMIVRQPSALQKMIRGVIAN